VQLLLLGGGGGGLAIRTTIINIIFVGFLFCIFCNRSTEGHFKLGSLSFLSKNFLIFGIIIKLYIIIKTKLTIFRPTR